jgi:hypothetical protein
MTGAAQILALSAALSLIGVVVIWAKRLRGPLLQRFDGTEASNLRPAGFALKILVLAFGLSVVAAILSIGRLMFA